MYHSCHHANPGSVRDCLPSLEKQILLICLQFLCHCLKCNKYFSTIPWEGLSLYYVQAVTSKQNNEEQCEKVGSV